MVVPSPDSGGSRGDTADPLPAHNPLRQPTRRRASRALLIFALVAGAAFAVLPHLDLLGGGRIPQAQALVPLATLVVLAMAVILALFRAWAAAAVLALAAVIAVVPTLTLATPGAFATGATACDGEEVPFSVLTFNAQYAGADVAELAEQIRIIEPDAVFLVEANETLIQELLGQQDLAEMLPERTAQIAATGAGGSVILSAVPLFDESQVPGSPFEQPTAVAQVPGVGEVRLVAVHPVPPVGGAVQWREGLDELDRWLQDAPDERVVVAGDFNASHAHPAFRALAAGFTDAATAAGPIPWPTWPSSGMPLPPFTAIDHILVRGGGASDWQSFAVAGSDHRAVAATLRLCGE